VGLAPAAHGANRTGRMFTGDSSGKWLYRALHRAGFASQAESISADDGMVLRDVFISAAAHCAPPDNKPTPQELANCFPYLAEEWDALYRRELVIALGSIAFKTVLKLAKEKGIATKDPKPEFGHDKLFEWDGLRVLTSYHPSRQNTQTGRLTEEMWDAIFVRAKGLIG